MAALDFGHHWYSTQFHPEASALTLGIIWKNSNPELRDNYNDTDRGDQLVENFFRIVVGNTAGMENQGGDKTNRQSPEESAEL